jgi:osmotically-inducible protein OsmY
MRVAAFPVMHTADERARTHEMAPEDAKLRARVQQALKAHGHLDATKIGVVVRDGQVLLWGSVATPNERSLAGEITARVVDRTVIINHIQVFRSSQC